MNALIFILARKRLRSDAFHKTYIVLAHFVCAAGTLHVSDSEDLISGKESIWCCVRASSNSRGRPNGNALFQILVSRFEPLGLCAHLCNKRAALF
jgi:hypothetical protein